VLHKKPRALGQK